MSVWRSDERRDSDAESRREVRQCRKLTVCLACGWIDEMSRPRRDSKLIQLPNRGRNVGSVIETLALAFFLSVDHWRLRILRIAIVRSVASPTSSAGADTANHVLGDVVVMFPSIDVAAGLFFHRRSSTSSIVYAGHIRRSLISRKYLCQWNLVRSAELDRSKKRAKYDARHGNWLAFLAKTALLEVPAPVVVRDVSL